MHRPASNCPLAQWLGWLETLSPNEIDLGLERVIEVLERLQLNAPTRVIHVAGTNGKGSSVAMLEALYLQQSSAVGCYTSPHILRYNERIRVAGEAVADELILNALQSVEARRQEVPLTYFEYTTLAALCVFEQLQAETIILEVGMGGRLDAVNAVEPDGGIITNVSLDHVAWLGDNIEDIGMEKAGILRRGKSFVFAAKDPPNSVVQRADELATDLRIYGQDYDYTIGEDDCWSFRGRDVQLQGLQKPALQGDFQIGNAAAVLSLTEALGDTELLVTETINAAFSRLQLPGRLQSVQRHRLWILDVAHNAGAATVLARSLATVTSGAKLTCIIGVLDDKNIADIVAPLLPQVETWIAVSVASPRAIPAAEIARVISNMSEKPCEIGANVSDVCKVLDGELASACPVLVTGSFFTVGPALEWLEG